MVNPRIQLINLETGDIAQYKTLKDLSENINIPYHLCRSLLLSDDKLYLHPKTKELAKKYKVIKI
jgi:hypothetical protein